MPCGENRIGMNPNKQEEIHIERIDKILASQGIGSRKEVHALLRQGRVTVGSAIVRAADAKVDATSQAICIDGAPLRYKPHVYIMMNKPAGVISATDDPRQRTVVDLISPPLARRGLFPVGRLDKDTEGLLIITDDGDYAHRVLSPKKNVDKLYEAVIDGPVGDAEVEAFRLGIVFEDGTVCRPAGLRVLRDGDTPLVQVRICEGRFHQVKKMFRAVGRTVQALRRVQIGALKLDPTLAPGAYREMTSQEITFVFEAQKDTPNIVQN